MEAGMFGLKRRRNGADLDLTRPLMASPQVSIAQRDGRAVLMDLRAGEYFGLDDVGTRIWQLIGTQATPIAIMDQLVDEYDASAEQLRIDATHFLTSLAALRLVQQ
jgi:hypothetical protein